jgi:hypothetical protein
MRSLVILCVAILTAACPNIPTKYLEDAKGKATQEEVLKEWGEPTIKEHMDTGEQIWRYRYRNQSSPRGGEFSSERELRFDENKIFQRWYDHELYCQGPEMRGLLCQHKFPGLLRPETSVQSPPRSS